MSAARKIHFRFAIYKVLHTQVGNYRKEPGKDDKKN